MTLLLYESVPTNATRKRIDQEAKAWGNAQDKPTWSLSERGSRVSSVLRSENVVSSKFLLSGIAGVLTQRVVPRS